MCPTLQISKISISKNDGIVPYDQSQIFLKDKIAVFQLSDSFIEDCHRERFTPCKTIAE